MTTRDQIAFNHTRFSQSVPESSYLPLDQQIEIAFAGRSNSGKSSVLNCLTRQKHLARTSKTPGRTQALNLFEIEHPVYLVDLPGYGYAEVSRKEQKRWQHFLTDYFVTRQSLTGVILIMDARHPLTTTDQLFLDLCEHSQRPCHILLNKVDKLKQQARNKIWQQVQQELLNLSMPLSAQFFSAHTGFGLLELKEVLTRWILKAKTLETTDC